MTTRSFKQARNYRQGRRGYTSPQGWSVAPNSIRAVVLHSMESNEKGSTAEDTQSWFAGPNAPMASIHKNFDSNSIAGSVNVRDEAFHAPPASRWAIGYEQAGKARQTAAEWHDPFSWAMLQIVATELALDCHAHSIPLVRRSIEEVKAGRIDGVYDHNVVSKAFGQSDHWDCGSGYPIDEVIAMARKGAHSVAPPEADSVLNEGDKGKAVEFAQGMLNILWRYRLTAKGKPGGQLLITNPAVFGPKTAEAVREFQRFCNVMLKMSGGKPMKVDGQIGKATASAIAYWVPRALKDPRSRR